jgi:hypothetical protein
MSIHLYNSMIFLSEPDRYTFPLALTLHIEEPKEFYWRPLERHHLVYNKSINGRLHKHMWYVHNNLKKRDNWLMFQNAMRFTSKYLLHHYSTV